MYLTNPFFYKGVSMAAEILEVDEDRLGYRVGYIKEKLLQMSKSLRDEIPEDLTDKDLTEDNTFKQWVIINSIYDASQTDVNNENFNRMLYYLFDKSKGNIARLVNNYDINIKLNSAGQLEDMNLVVLETETFEEDNNE